jgi:hypothetical protein
MVGYILPLIDGNPRPSSDKRRSIFSEAPHLCVDNHFLGDNVMHYLGINGLKATFTCCRNRLLEGVPKSYFHYDKVAVLPESKVARFQQPT